MKYRVCILTAGIGSRMEPFTNHINKSLLPVNFKAAISHIIEKFDVSIEIVVAVGHLKETVIDYLECAHNDRKFIIVEVDRYTGKGSGPGYSLMQCRDHLGLPFIFFASDTLVLEDIPEPEENWLGVSPVMESVEYCTTKIFNDKIIGLDDKIVSSNKNAFIGVAGVNDYKVFFDSLSKNTELNNGELQVSNGFNALIKYNLKPYNFTWYDTGNMKGYLNANNKISKSCQAFDFSKSDEFLYFVNKKVIKYFKDKQIVKNRYNRSKILKGLSPDIECIKDSFYAYKKVKGKVLYDVINSQIMQNFLNWIDGNLWGEIYVSESKLKQFKSACFNFYYKKTLLRINNYHNKHQIKDMGSRINEVDVPPIKYMLDFIDWDYISNGIISNFHGDLQFDNVLLKNDGNFMLLDWRQDFSGIVDYGDQYYDLAKLNGGLQVSYKLIKSGDFSFEKNKFGEIKLSCNHPEELRNSREILKTFIANNGLDINKVNILTSLVYLNMSPMHHEPFDHFIYNFGKLSLYNALLEQGSINSR